MDIVLWIVLVFAAAVAAVLMWHVLLRASDDAAVSVRRQLWKRFRKTNRIRHGRRR